MVDVVYETISGGRFIGTLTNLDIAPVIHDYSVTNPIPQITFYGGSGDDTVYGTSGDDQLFGGDGDNLIYADGGDDLVVTGTGDDVLYGGQGADTLYAGGGADYVVGGWGDDLLYGGAGADEMYGGAGVDLLFGGDGDDEMYGGSGDDTIDGGAGANAIYGGAGNDLITAGDGANEIYGGDGNDVISVGNGHNLIYGDGGDDTLTGGTSNDGLYGGDGDDVIDAGAGINTVDGGLGVNTISFASATAGVKISLGIVTAQNTGGDGTDTLLNIQNITGSRFNDALTGNAGNNTIDGGGGDDTLDGAGGVNTLTYASAGSAVKVSLALHGAQATGGGGTDTLANFQNLIGTAFDDTLEGSGGANVLDGGAGVNTVTYAHAAAGVCVSLGVSGPQSTGGAGTDTLINFRNLTGSAFDDTLQGGAGNNVLDGGLGVNTVSYANAAAAVNVSLAVSGPQDTGGAGTDTLLNFQNLTGSAFDDTLEGAAGSSVIDGGAGVNTVTYAHAASGVAVSLGLTGPQSTGGAGVDTLVNVQNLVGSAFDDTLQGSAGDNLLDGGAGVNTVSYAGASAAVSVSLALTGPQATGGAGTDTLADFQNLTGSAFDDTLEGDGGANVLDGGAGLNTASYAHAGSGVTVSLTLTGAQNTGGAGSDTLLNFQNLTGSAFGDSLTGSAGNNVIDGGSGDDTLSGVAGADTLYGGDGNDVLNGGKGADLLYGGAGADRYVFSSTSDSTVSLSGQDQVMDFSHADGDRIDLSAIDANTSLSGNQVFTLVSGFTHQAGQLIEIAVSNGYLVEGDTTGNGSATFAILVHASAPLTAADFIL